MTCLAHSVRLKETVFYYIQHAEDKSLNTESFLSNLL